MYLALFWRLGDQIKVLAGWPSGENLLPGPQAAGTPSYCVSLTELCEIPFIWALIPLRGAPPF